VDNAWLAYSLGHITCSKNIEKSSVFRVVGYSPKEVGMEKNKKRKQNALILLALLALLIGLLIPFTWRSFNAVKASLLQESTLSTTNSDSISGILMHGGWVPSSTPTNRPTATFTATVPPSAISTVTKTPPILLNLTSTVIKTATIPLTSTLTKTATYPPKLTETTNPTQTATSRTIVPLGETGTPESTEISTPTFTPTVTFTPTSTHTATASASPPPCLPCTATAQVTLTATTAPTATEVPPTITPYFPPTVGPGGNPGNYSTLGFVFGLIALAAFFLYFSGLIVSKRDPE